jgi:hypothetical protein
MSGDGGVVGLAIDSYRPGAGPRSGWSSMTDARMSWLAEPSGALPIERRPVEP